MLTDKQIEYLKETFLCYMAENEEDYYTHFIERTKIAENINSKELNELSELTNVIFYNPYFDKYKIR